MIMEEKNYRIYGQTFKEELLINFIGLAIGIVAFIVFCLLFGGFAKTIDKLDEMFIFFAVALTIGGLVLSYYLFKKKYCDFWEVSIMGDNLRISYKDRVINLSPSEIRRVKLVGNTMIRDIAISAGDKSVRIRLGFFRDKKGVAHKIEVMKGAYNLMLDLCTFFEEHNFNKRDKKKSFHQADVMFIVYTNK
ncbi:hypothetical protein SAMN04488018_101334 [Myroides marinus]|uniref:DUF304 domain-containing protein n=2 Tax=Myroides marinus TaxID=703342 RepID=A0A1H6RHT8_9FLAO|nr:hypothetical protein SAMN04488018_101334 [Myroides marinus]